MEYHYPKFTPEMKKTHTILIPNMAVTQFRLMEYALRCEGYKCELLGNCGSAVAQLGLKYVHNDTCYPALLVIGQFLDALNPSAAQGAGQGRLPADPGGKPELFRSGKGQRLPDDPPAGAQVHRLHLLRRYAVCAAQSGGPLRERKGCC